MPLKKSASRKAIVQNIKAETQAGTPRGQAIAIAMRAAGKPKRPKK